MNNEHEYWITNFCFLALFSPPFVETSEWGCNVKPDIFIINYFSLQVDILVD